MAAILFTCCLATGLVAAYLNHGGAKGVFHITNSARRDVDKPHTSICNRNTLEGSCCMGLL
jgi:hypothetical protein